MDGGEVAAHLLRRGVLSARDLVDAGVEIVDASRRNSNHRVVLGDGRGLLVKQGAHAEGRRSVAIEAAMLDGLHATGSLRRHLPPLIDWDAEAGVLVVGLAPRCTSLHAHALRTGRFSPGLATETGRVLGRLHGLPPPNGPGMPTVPATLGLHRPAVPVVADASPGALRLLAIVQSSPELVAGLEGLRGAWTASAWIHADAKWDNMLLLRTPAGRRSGLWLVDWEMAGAGDPRWDVATVIASHLELWVLTTPVTSVDPGPDLASGAYPLERMRPAMRAFIAAWCAERELDLPASEGVIAEVVRWAGGRLVLSAFEHVQMARMVWAGLVRLLQLAAHCLERPEQAAEALLGRGGSRTAA